ncbi:putative Protein FAM50 [Daphnia magna]|uniref:Uncharacterized protein n=1 Tax=Daphnia magna TaxID=35525 RepID=A0A162NSS4_9CRUS|nr:putative Protein FAM50 [Daphnia magna]
MAQYKGAASEGSRAMQMMKKREQAQEEVEFRKKKIEEELKLSGMKDKFASHYDAVEQQLKTSTIGLVTLDEMKAKQEVIVQEREKQLAKKLKEKEREIERELEAKRAEKKKQKQQIKSLSFKLDNDEEEEEGDQEEIQSAPSPKILADESESLDKSEEEPAAKKIKGNKNPDVDTSFLPDRDREEEENKLREELRQLLGRVGSQENDSHEKRKHDLSIFAALSGFTKERFP